MKTVYVKFSGGDELTTSINPQVPDEEIMFYYSPGNVFNIGTGPGDNIQTVVECTIIQPDQSNSPLINL